MSASSRQFRRSRPEPAGLARMPRAGGAPRRSQPPSCSTTTSIRATSPGADSTFCSAHVAFAGGPDAADASWPPARRRGADLADVTRWQLLWCAVMRRWAPHWVEIHQGFGLDTTLAGLGRRLAAATDHWLDRL